VADEKLRYSQRKLLAETGSLGDYSYDEASQTVRNALWYLIHEPHSTAHTNMLAAVTSEARLHFGWPGDETVGRFVQTAPVDSLLDLIEILIDTCTSGPFRSEWIQVSRAWRSANVMPDAEQRVNELCERHRFGYRFQNGEARKVGSPALDAEIVGPTLLAARRPGWDQVERSFREALDHQRGGETDDALTAAHAAVEAALKAAGMAGQFSAMLKQFRTSPVVPPYLRAVPEALDALLTLLDRSNAIRSTEGDAHGKTSGADDVPQALADLAIHWAGAFILYLSDTAP